MNNFENKKVVIMGLGNYENGSGISAALFFASRGAKVLVTDLKSEMELQDQIKRLEKYKNVNYVFGEHREKDFKNADFIFQNPSVPRHSPYLEMARENNIPIINDWSVFLSNHNNFLIGVTGTRGKSTTTTLLYQFIKTKNKSTILAGNIGVSPLKFYDKLGSSSAVVAELSSWLLQGFENIKKSPNIAIITNLMADHLNQYKSIEDYYGDKKNIFRFQKDGDFLVLNKDNKEAAKMEKEVKSKIFWFSKKYFKKENGVFIKGENILFRNNGEEDNVCATKDIKMIGRHNLENVLAAICGAKLYGISNAKIKMVLNKFRGIPNRLEHVSNIVGVKYYNDTTSTSPDGTIAALEALKDHRKKIALLAGGADKGLDYKDFAKAVKKSAKAIILFNGKATEKILVDLGEIKLPIICVDNMRDAVKAAKSFAKKGDIVLLSPGAASFGIFKNEFDRGEQFCRIIGKLK